jgi:methyl-accepting chemotaxis protein
MEQALKEKESGVDQQQRQEREGLNQNREDIVREGQQNQDIAKTTRKVFATVQGVNALISAMKVLSDESATTKEKVSGVAQSAVSGIGAAVSAFNPLVGMLIQIGGSLLVPVIADMIDFRSETEKLADKAKELQADFEKVSNTYQELKGTLSNYETAQKGLEGLEQGTVEFYEALMEANTQAQTLIDKLHLVAGQDYSIDVKTGLLKINADALEDAMFREQQNVMRAQVASLNAQYD